MKIFKLMTLLVLCSFLTAWKPLSYASTVPVTFFVSDQFTGIEYLDDYLPYYVAHMNTVLQKNTDITLTYAGYQVMVDDVEPQVITPFNPPLSQYDFPLWLVIHKSTDGFNHWLGMTMDVTEPEATVIQMSWTDIYNPNNPSNVDNYISQLHITLHEFAHELDVAIGEYYSVSSVTDMTGVAPLQNINIYNPSDEFWLGLPGTYYDPMFTMWHMPTVQETLNVTQFSPLSSVVMSRGRQTQQLPYLSGFTVRYLGVDGIPLTNGRIRVWNVVPNQSATLLTDIYAGEIYVLWDGSARSNLGMLKTVKFHKPGYVDALNYSIFHSDYKKYVQGLSEDIVVVSPSTYQSFADVSTNHVRWQAIESIYFAGITGGCYVNPLRFCPANIVTRSQIAVLLLRARYGGGYVPPAPVGIFADVPTNHWAAAWIEKFYVDGITSGCGTNPLRYCPDNNLTEWELNVFMSRYGGWFAGAPNRGNIADAIQRTFNLP